MMELFKPDMYQTLCDGETDENSSKKRLNKCIDKSKKFLKECLEYHYNSEVCFSTNNS